MSQNPLRPLGLYIHWPFCPSKCPYCDFNSHVREGVDQQRWQRALLQELHHAAQGATDQHLVSIFFGGGTPSLMAPETVNALIDAAKALFPHGGDLEVTLEANPGTLTREKCEGFRGAGVTRLSMGVQSLHDEALAFLGRRHSAAQALDALEMAAAVFPRFSFDLIYARPEQTEAAWRAELSRALTYARGHLSLYQLTIEPQTAFATRSARGETMTLAPDSAASLYEVTETLMTEAGLPSYEVSNYAALGQECRHNLLYWNVEDYLGIGPGAHGRCTREGIKHATSRYKAPETWLTAVESQGHGLEIFLPLSSQEKLQEVTLMGLRLTEGLSLSRLQAETNMTLEEAYPGLKALEKEGLVRPTATHLIVTPEGRLRLNSLTAFLLYQGRE